MLSLSPGVLLSVALLIEDGNDSDVYHAANLGQLLGIVDLTNQTFNNAQIPLVSGNLLSGTETNIGAKRQGAGQGNPAG